MAITATMVKELREMTGAGMMDCKKALSEANGDMDKAVEILREKGLAKAAKKAGRIAAEGLVANYISEDGKVGALVEVNSETDFVAKNEEFKTFAAQVAKQAAMTKTTTIEDFKNEAWLLDSSKTVEDVLTEKISVIGENLNIRRFVKFETETGVIVSYIHGGGRIGVLVELASQNTSDKVKEAAKDIAMQIAAANPQYITKDEIPADFIEKEREILKQQALNEGKPANIVEKMIEGRLAKNLKELCLVDQQFIKDPDITVAKYLEGVSKEVGTNVTIKAFARYETGEGLEKKEENFAEEVAKQMNL
ncbi:MAG: elongation factor Ts [Epulopiscium sp.]|jgi:elongation factor Ts|uniref:Elongation factor Ts n=1 Tax=Defluviitalea raffinosedens TaxID=1450156 RepID=A0A7C8HG84_9FIRM|nr:translation elongation factor Ts [Defluviitalea raffinosedens]MBZ4669637.1 tsf [Defluviitaleaceae bacterium]MDK2787181.1 elongation factor Ts [Candidatus Epulonipiscium sp.]KAE9637069.1 elongation factor Ts [Defluviitalea raffinosedens]MBM7685174.1 elongation factor Ts [Defluviitalea raffinosedens]HHW67387.1 elongation factor Ts [Candidatus Epulonipiscium sp.]